MLWRYTSGWELSVTYTEVGNSWPNFWRGLRLCQPPSRLLYLLITKTGNEMLWWFKLKQGIMGFSFVWLRRGFICNMILLLCNWKSPSHRYRLTWQLDDFNEECIRGCWFALQSFSQRLDTALYVIGSVTKGHSSQEWMNYLLSFHPIATNPSI